MHLTSLDWDITTFVEILLPSQTGLLRPHSSGRFCRPAGLWWVWMLFETYLSQSFFWTFGASFNIKASHFKAVKETMCKKKSAPVKRKHLINSHTWWAEALSEQDVNGFFNPQCHHHYTENITWWPLTPVCPPERRPVRLNWFIPGFQYECDTISV